MHTCTECFTCSKQGVQGDKVCVHLVCHILVPLTGIMAWCAVQGYKVCVHYKIYDTYICVPLIRCVCTWCGFGSSGEWADPQGLGPPLLRGELKITKRNFACNQIYPLICNRYIWGKERGWDMIFVEDVLKWRKIQNQNKRNQLKSPHIIDGFLSVHPI